MPILSYAEAAHIQGNGCTMKYDASYKSCEKIGQSLSQYGNLIKSGVISLDTSNNFYTGKARLYEDSLILLQTLEYRIKQTSWRGGSLGYDVYYSVIILRLVSYCWKAQITFTPWRRRSVDFVANTWVQNQTDQWARRLLWSWCLVPIYWTLYNCQCGRFYQIVLHVW